MTDPLAVDRLIEFVSVCELVQMDCAAASSPQSVSSIESNPDKQPRALSACVSTLLDQLVLFCRRHSITPAQLAKLLAASPSTQGMSSSSLSDIQTQRSALLKLSEVFTRLSLDHQFGPMGHAVNFKLDQYSGSGESHHKAANSDAYEFQVATAFVNTVYRSMSFFVPHPYVSYIFVVSLANQCNVFPRMRSNIKRNFE